MDIAHPSILEQYGKGQRAIAIPFAATFLYDGEVEVPAALALGIMRRRMVAAGASLAKIGEGLNIDGLAVALDNGCKPRPDMEAYSDMDFTLQHLTKGSGVYMERDFAPVSPFPASALGLERLREEWAETAFNKGGRLDQRKIARLFKASAANMQIDSETLYIPPAYTARFREWLASLPSPYEGQPASEYERLVHFLEKEVTVNA